ncbi:MAG: hypothetical protein Q8867_10610, partial [Bacteroidota bacterium]|nr:hypothetical protein [Bacteroidota bacterium]
ETSGDPIKKAALIKEIVKTISLIPDAISRSVYTKECSSMMDVPEQTLINELNRALRKRFTKKLHEQEQEAPPEFDEPVDSAPRQLEYDLSSCEAQEKEIIRLLLYFGNEKIPVEKPNEEGLPIKVDMNVAELILNDIRQDDLRFESITCQQIFNEISQLMENKTIPDRAYFLNHPNPHIATLAIDLSIAPYELSQNWQKNSIFVTPEKDHLTDSVLSGLCAFKAKKIDRMIEKNQKKLLTAKGPEEAIPLLEEQIWLKNKSREINQTLGRIITR